MSTRFLGNAGEQAAVTFLKGLGWRIIAQNLRSRFGEIDILANAGHSMVLVEVKVKRSTSHGQAVEMITPTKRRILIRLAKWIEREYNKPVRIDVIAIDNFTSSQPVIAHYPFAIGEE